MKFRSFAIALLASLVALALVPVAAPRPAAQRTTTVTVTMKEFKFALSKKAVRHGTVVFKLVNKGALAHDFKIAGKKSKLIPAHKSGTFKVTLKKGTQTYICTVPGHAAAGMKGKLKVT